MKSLAHIAALAFAVAISGCSLLSSDDDGGVSDTGDFNGVIEEVEVLFVGAQDDATLATFAADNYLVLAANYPPPGLYAFLVDRTTAPDSTGVGDIVASIRENYQGVVDEVSGCRTVLQQSSIVEQECY